MAQVKAEHAGGKKKSPGWERDGGAMIFTVVLAGVIVHGSWSVLFVTRSRLHSAAV
jgi:hypothetical protein